ncbi:MAG TPA: thioredoxin domain-containing protein [Pyrinomonadaceae bacterium]|nr:thioredoxin domain-containing protein [Pyrinomonadaceae bacterium]
MKTPTFKLIATAAILAACCTFAGAQKRKRATHPAAKAVAGPKVTEVNVDGLKALLKPGDKPRLINFWATWCDPCREEFPDLVKLDATYKGKIDFVAVSLDDFVDINTTVPKFLTGMKATMPAYLLHTSDEDAAIAAISSISPDFQGNLPFTILIKPTGELAYSKNGKIKPLALTAEIDKLLTPAQ